MRKDVSFIVPFRAPENEGVDRNWREDSWSFIQRYWNENLVSSSHLTFEFCTAMDQVEFNRSRARNKAYINSTGDVLVIADADTIVSPKALASAIEKVQSGEVAWSIPYTDYYNLSLEYTGDLLDAGDVNIDPSKVILNDWQYEHKVLSHAGVLVVPKAAYNFIGGYDECFETWGYEDNAFRLVMDNEWGEHSREVGDAWHFWHPIAPKDMFTRENTVANFVRYNEYVRRYGHKDERLEA